MHTQLTIPLFGNMTTSIVMPTKVRDILPNPDSATRYGAPASRAPIYELLRQYYNNTAFDESSQWSQYLSRYNLYKYSRGIFNPFFRLVNFYGDHIYPGTYNFGSEDLPKGIQDALPWSHGTPPELKAAINRILSWSNWSAGSEQMVNYSATTGNCLLEIEDSLLEQRVKINVIWASNIREIELDSTGRVIFYSLEYRSYDREKQQTFTFRKDVSRTLIVRYTDGDRVGTETNPYPFVPAVWVRHGNNGSVFGIPAMTSFGKMDELNSIASHTSDHVHKLINSPRIIFSNGMIKPLFGDQNTAAVDEHEFDARRDTMFLKAPAGGSTETLVGNLDPATVIPVLERMIGEIEADYPELIMYKQLRDQNIVTAPGATLLMGDVQKRVSRVATSYDRSFIRALKMAISIAGWRLSNGWDARDPQIAVFKGYGFESLTDDAFKMSLLPRTLIQPTTGEAANELQLRAQAAASVAPFVPAELVYRMLDVAEDKIPAMIALQKSEAAEKQAGALALAQATKPKLAQVAPASKPPTSTA